jgi:bacillithiol biosynthesis deacetylase BshB1
MIPKEIIVDILAFGAHPDDVECAAAGVLLKHIALGQIVAIVDLTAGEMGSYGTVEERKDEAATAAMLMGVKKREQLNLPDGGIENNEPNRVLIIEMIRKYRPAIVLANAIHDRHPDHANAAKLVSDAAFLSGLKMKKTFYNGIEQEAWRPNAVYHYIQDYFIEPGFVIDITEQMDKKMEAILSFKSQFVAPKVKQPNSILSLIDQIKNMNSIYGRPINAAYAEGFSTGRYIGVNDLFQLI